MYHSTNDTCCAHLYFTKCSCHIVVLLLRFFRLQPSASIGVH